MRKAFIKIFVTVGSLSVSAISAHAGVLDLTTAGSFGTLNGAQFYTNTQQTTGTGVIDPFVRIQDTGVEEGYNTNSNSPGFDEKTGIFTHSLTLADLVIETIGGVQYYEFLLDINQTNANPLLSLTEIQIYTNANVSSASTNTTNLASLGDLRFDLDGNEDNTVKLNYDLNPGSGAGDLYFYVPISLFSADALTEQVIFYSQFGGTPPLNASNDGPEEWAIVKGAPNTPCGATECPGDNTVPDGGSMAMLLGIGLMGIAAARRMLS